ncbi:hypothetical protein KAJ61_05595 [Candidatus Parcubacteria bacterium]|nr:hypothetical protein [Candidatus Parcubacteria bacterium]
MAKIDNLKLFEFSLNSPEPIIDEFYLKNGDLIISKNPKKPTDLMLQNVDLIESVSAYSFSKKTKSPATAQKALKKILEIIKSKNINYSEFVSFWSVIDISYSIFCKMNDKEKLKILKNITEKYIELRHGTYSIYGYTPTALQAGKDAKAHKESGNLGIYKVSKILNSRGFKKTNNESIKKFISGKKKYIESDKKGKKLFKDLLKYYKIDFKWSSKKENKMPDFLIRHKDDIYIVEHKHTKEGGGGQNNQINEIISLIGHSENNKKIHYISFLDGIYFNLFANKKLNQGKILNQINNIKNNLKNNKQNYFVNTAGFKKLLKNL